jgi:probable phosphoglycerate mutase
LEIVLVRHAQPDWEPDDRAVDNPGLTPLGHAQADCIAQELKGEHFDAVYLSPLRRVVETAAPYLEASGHRGNVRDWLRETEVPSLEGQTRAQVEDYFGRANAREFAEWWDGPPGGERFRHFYARVSGGIETLLGDGHAAGIHEEAGQRLWKIPEEAQRIAIFAHEGTNAVVVSHLLGVEPVPWTHLRFSTSWAGITRLHTARVGSRSVWSLESFNRVSHLDSLQGSAPGLGRSGSY